MPDRASEVLTREQIANCAMAVDSMIGGWTAIDPARITPEQEAIYRRWREFERQQRQIDLKSRTG